jgi:hypothetical protein
MAIDKTIKLNLQADDVIKKLENIEKELGDVKKGVEEGTDQMGKLTESTDKGASSMTALAGGIGTVGIALKAVVASGFIRIFDLFFTLLQNNQRVLDSTNKAFETLNISMRRLINNVSRATTKKAMNDFFKGLKDFEVSSIDLTQILKNAVAELNLFNFGLQNIGRMLFGATGVPQGIKDTVESARELAEQIVELRNEVILAEADQRLLQFTFQRQAEIQRQVRDDISLTIEKRIEANNKLGDILNDQLEQERIALNKRKLLAELELSTDQENVQLKANLTNALADLADLEERITGQQSEQLINLKALEQERFDQRKANTEELITLKHQELDVEKNYTKGLIDEMAKRAEAHKKTKEQETKIDVLTAKNKRDIVAETMGQISSLMGEETKAGKALAIGQALINTYSAVASALAPPPIGAGPIFGPIVALGALASGMKNVQDIKNTQLPGVTGDVGPPSRTPSVPTEVGGISGMIPNFENITGVGTGEMQPVQAFVVENDISNAQALQEELDIQSTL